MVQKLHVKEDRNREDYNFFGIFIHEIGISIDL